MLTLYDTIINTIKKHAYAHRIPIAIIGGLILCTGCNNSHPGFTPGRVPAYDNHALGHSEKDEQKIIVKSIEEMRFIMGQGSGLSGYDMLVVSHDGKSLFLYNKMPDYGQDWWLIEFEVKPQVVKDLRGLLKDIHFFSLPKSYHANVHDGGQWFVKVRCTEGKKVVYCNNHFPRKICRVSDFAKERILTKEILSAKGNKVKNYRKTWLMLSEGGESTWKQKGKKGAGAELTPPTDENNNDK